MPPKPAAGSATSSTDAALGKAPPIAMAPGFQSQVQKWAKMTAELGPKDDTTRPAKRQRTDASKKGYPDKEAPLSYGKKLRAPHRHDRLVSFGVGRGLGKRSDKHARKDADKHARKDADKDADTGQPDEADVPPTCLLCLVRFGSRQQLRDHESLSAGHKARLRDASARKSAFQRYALAEAGEHNTNGTGGRPPDHVKRVPRRRGDPAPSYASYAAIDGANGLVACLLCRRRFTTVATLRLHERESALHRARLRVPALVQAAVDAVHARGEDVAQMHAQGSQYRDRARERRQALGGPSKRREKDSRREEAVDRGAALLSKMGWSAGQGLGAQGSGRVEAIAPSAYRAGAGLGVQGGKLGDAADVAARRTESTYADFVEQAQEGARKRYQALRQAEAEQARELAEREAEAKVDTGADTAQVSDEDVDMFE